ncbi:lysophospholipid acyltransferase family protein [Spirochaetota bacterium]
MAGKPAFLIYLEYFFAKPFLVFPTLFSYRINMKVAKILGILAYYLVASARKVSMRNLELVFKDEFTKARRKEITKKVFINMGYTLFELINFPNLHDDFFKKKVYTHRLENVKKALDKGKGVIACTCHLVNWEVAAAATALSGIPVNAIVRLLDNPLLDDYVESYRREKGVKIIPKQYALKRGIRALRNNELLAILVDQNAAVNGEFVPFFGIPASTMRGAAVFHKMTGSPVICCYQIRKDNGEHHIYYSEEIPMTRNIQKDLSTIMHFYEDIIIRYPENYLWVHPRWKKRPEGEDTLYPGIPL